MMVLMLHGCSGMMLARGTGVNCSQSGMELAGVKGSSRET